MSLNLTVNLFGKPLFLLYDLVVVANIVTVIEGHGLRRNMYDLVTSIAMAITIT